MPNTERHLKNASLVMSVAGWLCMALPVAALLYPPGILWGSVAPDASFPNIGPDHAHSPYDGLHPYFFMLAAMYVSYGFLMVRGANQPMRNVALFDYGIAANLLHGGIMVPMAFYYPNEHAHMCADIPAAFALVAALMIWHPRKVEMLVATPK